MTRCRWALAVPLLCLPLTMTRAAEPIKPVELREKARTVLARLEGEIVVPGLRERVEVLRDRWGVPHIYAKNQDDLFFAQGFVCAQDRLFQMDLWRRLARGEMAELLGKDQKEVDRLARLLRFRGDLNAEWASYGRDAKQIATAFTRGINACIDNMGDRLPIEFLILKTKPGRWEPEDVLGRMSGIVMTHNFRHEISRAQLIAAVGLEKARRIAPTDPPRDFAPAPGLDLAGIDKSILAGYEAATQPLKFHLGSDGSNNWVVAGTRSASGKPLLASDPHRGIALPSLRYLVHLNAPGWNVIGSGEPALPGVAIGHNEHVAWGFTIVGTDQADLYIEETHPDDPTRYRVGERWESMKVVREKVRVRGEAKPVEMELRFTRHGPVLHQDVKRRRAFALRWIGAEPGGAAYLGCLVADRARNAREFRAALKLWKSPSENMVFADVDGNIGWVAAGWAPIRKGWDGLLPVPGASGRYEWQGFLDVADLPQTLNPKSGYVATANHNILPARYSREIGYEWAPSFRIRRIRQVLEGQQRFSLDDFRKLQHDTLSLPGQALAGLLRIVGVNDPALKPHADLLSAWDGNLSADSRAGALYAAWLRELTDGFFRQQVPRDLVIFAASNHGLELMLDALMKPDSFWFGAKPAARRDELVRRTFAAAVQKLRKAAAKGDVSRLTWG
ncbi:MAG TPA: penicillin acylase family protein, partial [Gemmataceae bacterium]|nr:penicillin acylase family protein [Gemmataceae bacterium]